MFWLLYIEIIDVK